LPEFFYASLYGTHPRKYVELVARPTVRRIQRPQGLYQPDFLCEACETRFSVYEQYARRLLYDAPVQLHDVQDHEALWLSSIDYRLFKLFQASVIWKAGACELEEYSAVRLGPHEPKLRSMLLQEDPGGSLDYPCLIEFCPALAQKLGRDFVIPPVVGEFEGEQLYRFAFAGFFWDFVVPKLAPSSKFAKFLLREDGSLGIIRMDTPWKGFPPANWDRS
jgi:hypothetical protein